MIDAGVPLGLGVDGSASNERSDLVADVKQALPAARGRGGPEAMTAARRSGSVHAAERTSSAAGTWARSSRGSVRTSPSGASTGSSSAAPTTSSRPSSCRGRTARSESTSAGSRQSSTGSSPGPTSGRSPPRTACRPPASSTRCRPAETEGDEDRGGRRDGGHRVRDHERHVGDGDAVGEPEQEADEQHLLVADRDWSTRPVGAHRPHLEKRSERRCDTPGCRRNGQVRGHETS